MNTLTKIHFINFSRKLTTNTIFFLIPVYFMDIGFSGWQIGVLSSVFAFTPVLFSFPAGLINDRLSIRKVIHWSLALMALLFILIGVVKGFVPMMAILLLLGISSNALEVSTNNYYYKDDTAIDLNRKFGLFNFWLSIGSATGVLLGGIITFYADFPVMFFLFALYLIAVLITVRTLPEGSINYVTLREYSLNLFNKKTFLFSILIFVMTLHWGVESTIYSPFLKQVFHLNNIQMALYISLPLFILSFASFSLIFIKHNPKENARMFLISMVLSGLGHILMVQRNLYVSFFFRVVHEIGDGVMAALIFVFISRLFEKRSIGGNSGMLIALMTLGHVVGAIIFSNLGFYQGMRSAFIISGILLVINAGFGLYIFSRHLY